MGVSKKNKIKDKSPIESTLDPQSEIQEISTLNSWITYWKIKTLKDEVINLVNEAKWANLTISILREIMQLF